MCYNISIIYGADIFSASDRLQRGVNMDHEFVLILDFGGQYNQLIARRVRECSVYCEVKPYNKITLDEIRSL